MLKLEDEFKYTVSAEGFSYTEEYQAIDSRDALKKYYAQHIHDEDPDDIEKVGSEAFTIYVRDHWADKEHTYKVRPYLTYKLDVNLENTKDIK